jgi:hypothetical protein
MASRPVARLALWLTKWSGLDAEVSPRALKVVQVAAIVYFAVRRPLARGPGGPRCARCDDCVEPAWQRAAKEGALSRCTSALLQTLGPSW